MGNNSSLLYVLDLISKSVTVICKGSSSEKRYSADSRKKVFKSEEALRNYRKAQTGSRRK